MAQELTGSIGGAVAYVGARVLIEGDIRARGVPTDPTLLIFKIRTPSGRHVQITVPDDAINKRDIGLYEANVVVDEAGLWGFRWEGAGVVDAVGEVTLQVIESSVS